MKPFRHLHRRWRHRSPLKQFSLFRFSLFSIYFTEEREPAAEVQLLNTYARVRTTNEFRTRHDSMPNGPRLMGQFWSG